MSRLRLGRFARSVERSPGGRVGSAEPSEDGRNVEAVSLVLRTLALREPSTARHAASVARLGRELAVRAGLDVEEIAVVHAAGLLHDIGKQAFPDSVLVAERSVGVTGRRVIERHPVDGARLIADLPGLQAERAAIIAHHERIDGSGYPYGLRGDRIPLAARAIAVAEVFDALTAPDSYRGAVEIARAAHELELSAGTQLDPDLVGLFIAEVLSAEGSGRAGTDAGRPLSTLDRELQVLAAPLTAHGG